MVINRAELATARIHSRQDLQEYTATTPAKNSPLTRLSPDARQRFVASLTFNERGITGFEYADLEAELTPSEIYQLLALFGVQRTAAFMTGAHRETEIDAQLMDSWSPYLRQDHEKYRCESVGTCVENVNRICTSNC